MLEMVTCVVQNAEDRCERNSLKRSNFKDVTETPQQPLNGQQDGVCQQHETSLLKHSDNSDGNNGCSDLQLNQDGIKTGDTSDPKEIADQQKEFDDTLCTISGNDTQNGDSTDIAHQDKTNAVVPKITDSVTIENLDDDDDDGSSGLSEIEDSDDDLTTDGVVIRPGFDQRPSVGNVNIENSQSVFIGNKTVFHGPVTILKQVVHSEDTEALPQLGHSDKLAITDKNYHIESGLISDNLGFVPDNLSKKCDKLYGNLNNSKNSDIKFDEQSSNVGNRTSKFLEAFPCFREHYSSYKLTVVVILLVVVAVSLMTVLIIKHPHDEVDSKMDTALRIDNDEQEKRIPIKGTNVEPVVSGKLRILDRQEWIAQPEEHPSDPLKLPVPYVIIHHTATNNCSAIAQCKFHVRQIQTYHIESNGWWDIGYNFLVGGDGFAYRGRGWEAQGAHLYGYNSKSIGIAFIGTFNKIAPPKRQVTAALQLIAQGVEKGYIDKNYKVLAARQLQSTLSPGDVLFDIVKTFPHWAEVP